MNEKKFGRITFIPGPNGGRYPFCNSLCIDDRETVVIDPGSDERLLKRYATETGLDIVMNSHYHEDHTSLNYLFPEAKLYVHEDETPCYTSLENLLDFYGLLGTPMEHTWRGLLVNHFHYRERTPDLGFRDGDLLNFGDTTVRILHTPGHTIGHTSFFFPEEGVLFLGDLDMTAFGPWYGDRVSDIDQTIESLHTVLEIPARIFITSHEAGILEGDITELAEGYLGIIDRREETLLAFLERPRTLTEIVNQWIIYKKPREPRDFFEFGERGMIKKHLDRLIKKEIVTAEEDRYSLV